MGLFSKLNFRAVDNAYRVVTTFNFFTQVLVRVCDRSESLDDCIDVVPICEAVAHDTVEALGRVSTKELELATAIQRVANTAQGTINELTLDDSFPTVAFILSLLSPRLGHLSDEILKAARHGYLNGSFSDYAYVIDKNMGLFIESHDRFDLRSRKQERHPAKRQPSPPRNSNNKKEIVKRTTIYSTEANKEHQAKLERREKKLAAEKNRKEKTRQKLEKYQAEKLNKDREAWRNRWKKAALKAIPKAKSKLREYLQKKPASYSRCPECNQALNIDRLEKNITCPRCGYLWKRGTAESFNGCHTSVVEANSCAIKDGILVEHVGIEVGAGGFQQIFPSGTSIPCEIKVTITAAEYQHAQYGVKIFRGLTDTTNDAFFLGQCDLEITPQTPDGGLEIEMVIGVSETDIWLSVRSMIDGYKVAIVKR
jgi:hypothetical protein